MSYLKFFTLTFILILLSFNFSTNLYAQTDSNFSTHIYGYIESYLEKVFDVPSLDENGKTVKESEPYEFDIPHVSLMIQGFLMDRYSYFLSLSGEGAKSVNVKNVWLDVSLYQDYLKIRTGKLYRKFGLYNEILDAVPTYIGIEPPELFDKDHLLLTRTTNFMLYGNWQRMGNKIFYSVMTGNDERKQEQLPIGFDLHYDFKNIITIGTSFYSTNGDAAPTCSVGEGSPEGGVATWMDKDDYIVYGGYLQLTSGALILQAELWQSKHNGKRNKEEVLKLLDANLNPRQKERFGIDGESPTLEDVIVDADYKVTTYYTRLGYQFETRLGDIIPYLQYDFYRNPETIANKEYGGDNEAGLSDNGQFYKVTGGIVFRPIPAVALKIDGSAHIQEFNGAKEIYPEIRSSFSYLWKLRNETR